MNDASGALGEIGRLREALADRVRLPWWYVAVFALAVLGLLGAPLVMRLTSWEVGNWGVLVPAVVVMLLLDRVLGFVVGARLPRGTLRVYPSSRPGGLTMIGVVVVGLVGVQLLMRFHDEPVAVVVAAVATVGAVRCLVWQTAGIRKDIREGRVVAA